jgi:hypothetical protein
MIAPATTVRRFMRAAVILAAAVWSRDARAQVTVSGSPAQLTISTATAGSAPNAVTNSNTSYSVTKPPAGNSYEITAYLSAAMPTGVTLTIALAGGTAASAGTVTLSTTPQMVVTSITKKLTSEPITYTLSATPAAGVVPVSTRRVTFTVIQIP